jgi:hypothetical protein
MNEELNLAIDELRLRPTDRAWFIPLRLNECTIPDRAIGGGQQLSDIHYIDLSRNWDDGIRSLVEVLVPLEPELISLYSRAREALAESIRRSKLRCKTNEFTIGFTGLVGVGISELLRHMKGFHEQSPCADRSPVAQDGVEVHRIDDVLRILDIRTWNRTRFRETLEREVDLLIDVLAVSSRIRVRELEEIQTLPDVLPCLVVISKWDLTDKLWDTRLCETVESHTGRPVVVFSREIEYTWRLMNRMLVDLGAVYRGPSRNLWRLLGISAGK